MGSSEDTSNKGIDLSVGGLVWVRRRNGSWWPGQILGPEEVPERCLVSPKAGTPVKLLGREDASVDWYNLEKSKRVKAFRCGEYDECIEKAKAAAAAAAAKTSKKAVKYARREDAIIHALELETARLSNGRQDVCSKMDSKVNEESSPCSVHSHQEVSDTITSTSNNESDYVLEESANGNRPNDSENDDTEGVKRMRGLKDLGMGGGDVAASSFKGKRSQAARVQEILKKKLRRKTLTKVMENTMVTVPIMCEELVVPTVSYLSCENGTLFNGSNTSLVKLESKGQESSMENGSSDNLFEVPLLAEEEDRFACYNKTLGAVEMNGMNEKTEKDGKEWQLKGKRNSRNAGKSKKQEDRLVDIDEESDGYLVGKDCKFKPISEIELTELKGWTRSNKEESQRLLPYRHSRFIVNPKYDPSDISLRNHIVDNSLYDVNVEVQSSSCRPQHVPYISLMSKLSGRPIVGHHLTVEVLKDGFCDELMSSFERCDLGEEDETTDLPSGVVTKIQAFQSPKSRRNGVLSKKIRKLSSITCSRKQVEEEEEEEPKARMEKLKSPVVACVPLNVVFSRINAALSGSTRPSIHRLMPGDS